MSKLTITGCRSALLASAAIAASGLAGQAHAAAFYLQEQSTVAVGRAFSGEVSEQGAAQQWWNPAATGGITGIQNYIGITAILPHADATNIDTTFGHSLGTSVPVSGVQNDHNPVHNGYLPNGGFAVPLGDKFDFGFTMTSPYSFTTNYGDKSWARYGADKSRLRTFDFQPSFAYHTGGLSIGAGPNIEYLRATLSNFLPDPVAPQVNPDGHQYLKGSGWDVGYSVGFQYHNDKVDIGASYKSAIKHTLNGHLILSGISTTADPIFASIINQRDEGAKATFETPWQVDLGMRYHLTPKLTIEGQINRFGWDKFDQITITGLPALLGTQVIAQNYHNTFSYALGFDYKVSPKLTVRSGVQRDMSPISSGNRDPRVPDGNRWNFAAGGSYEMNQFMGLDLAASYDKIKSGTIDRSEPLYGGTLLQTELFNDGYLHNGRAIVLSLGGHLNF